MRRPSRRLSVPRSRDVSRGPAPFCAAEVLEDRALLSATFAADTSQLVLSGFTQIADEDLTIRENGATYEFVLSEGTWSGADGGGVTGAGTGTLVVSKAAAAGLAGGIDVNAAGVQADVTLETADFSTLAGGLTIVGTGTVSQAAGRTLKTADLLVGGRRAELRGTIDGGAGDVEFWVSRDIVVNGATITTAGGTLALRCTDFTVSGSPPDATGQETGGFSGVTVIDSILRTDTGAVTIVGRGGTAGSVQNPLHGVTLIDSAIRSTGGGAGQVTILGYGGDFGAGVFFFGSHLESAEGDVFITGFARNSQIPGVNAFGNGVGIHQGTLVWSTGAGANAATITIHGHTDAYGAGVGLSGVRDGEIPSALHRARVNSGRGPAAVRSADGAIHLRGIGTAAGVELEFGRVISTGVGAYAANVAIEGLAGNRGVYVAPSSFSGPGTPITTVDGDLRIDGISTAPTENSGFPYGISSGQGVLLAHGIAATGDGNVTVAGAAADGNGAVWISPIVSDIEHGPSAGVRASTGDVTIIGDTFYMAAGLFSTPSTVVSDAGGVKIVTRSAGRRIELGGDDAAGALALSNRELNAIGTKYLQIGDQRAGEIRLVGPVTRRYGAGVLALVTPGSVVNGLTPGGTTLTVDGLDVLAGANFGGPQAGVIDAATTSFTADVNGEVFLENDGDLTLGDLAARRITIFVDGAVTIAPGAELDTARLSFEPPTFIDPPEQAPGPITPVNVVSLGDEPVTGTFVGLPEGAVVVVHQGNQARITYQGGDGNDIVVTLNRRPSPGVDEVRIVADGPVHSGNVLTNDSDRDDDPLTVVAVRGSAANVGTPFTLPTGAVVLINPDGSYSFDPNGGYDFLAPGESEVIEITYAADDGKGGRNFGTLRIVVRGAGRTDLVGYADGEWYATTYSPVFNPNDHRTSLAAQWADVAWDALLHADANGDGRSDVIGLLDGQWWIGYAAGAGNTLSYSTVLADQWADADWRDAMLRDLNGDGLVDLLARAGGQWWAALSDGFGGGYLAETRWAGADPNPLARVVYVPADEVFVEDVDGDDRADLIEYRDGDWWVSLSTGSRFSQAKLWATWADVEWQGLGVFDVNGDGGADLFGLHGDRSYYGVSLATGQFFVLDGERFATLEHARWENRIWEDVRAGDFDGDGLVNDLAARSGGQWWVALSDFPPPNYEIQDLPRLPRPATAALWAEWADVDWEDVRTGDFNEDGRTDLVGRYEGEWYLAAWTDGDFTSRLIAVWREVDWQAVAAVDFDGLTNWPIPAGSRGIVNMNGGGTSADHPPTISMSGSITVTGESQEAPTTASVNSEDALDLFWSQADEDEAFADGLLAGV